MLHQMGKIRYQIPLFGLGGMGGAFFFLFVLFLVGRGIAVKGFGDFVVSFFPILVRIGNFADEIEPPSEVFGFGINDIEDQSAFTDAGGGDGSVYPTPIRADIGTIRTPIAQHGDVDFLRGVGPVTDNEIGILARLNFTEPFSGEFADNGTVNAILDQVGIELKHDEIFNATEVGEGLVFEEIEVGVEIDGGLRERGGNGEKKCEKAQKENGFKAMAGVARAIHSNFTPGIFLFRE
jgi:hypothetical protein